MFRKFELNRTTLTLGEKVANKNELEFLYAICVSLEAVESTVNRDKDKVNSLLNFLHDYCTQENITLQNLNEKESNDLLKILTQALQLRYETELDSITIQKELDKWKQNLLVAIDGKSDPDNLLAKMHQSLPNSFASSLLQTGEVPLTQWGTDLDMMHCISDVIAHESKISAPGIYVLPAKPLLGPSAYPSFKESLNKVILSLQAANVTGHVSIRIPAICDNHWRLAKIEIHNQKIQSAVLWDSLAAPAMPQDASLSHARSLENLRTVCYDIAGSTIPIRAEFAGIQKNAHSCLDYVVQAATKERKDSIQQAGTDAGKLRFAIVKRAVKNHSMLGPEAARNLQLQTSGICLTDRNPAVENRQLNEAQKTKFLNFLTQDKDMQQQFDNKFAAALQNLYSNNPNANDEKSMEKEAFAIAYKTHGIFKEKSSGKSLTDNNQLPGKKRRLFSL